MSILWLVIHSSRRFESAYGSCSHWGDSLQLFRLWQIVPIIWQTKDSYKSSQRGEALYLYSVFYDILNSWQFEDSYESSFACLKLHHTRGETFAMFRMYNVVFSVQLALLKRPLRAHIIGNRHCSLVSNSIAHISMCHLCCLSSSS